MELHDLDSCIYLVHADIPSFNGEGWYGINKYKQIKGPFPEKEWAAAQVHRDNKLPEPE